MRALQILVPLSLALLAAACGDEDSTSVADDAAPGMAQQDASNDPAPAPPSANGVSADGQITATLDGELRTWYVTSKMMNGERQSQSDFSDMGYVTSVSLFGHAKPNSVFGSKQALLIGFSVSGIGENPTVNSPEIEYLEGGLSKIYSSTNGGTEEITLTSAELDGDTLKVSGTFNGTLKFHPIGSAEPDDGKMEVTLTGGTFNATIGGLKR